MTQLIRSFLLFSPFVIFPFIFLTVFFLPYLLSFALSLILSLISLFLFSFSSLSFLHTLSRAFSLQRCLPLPLSLVLSFSLLFPPSLSLLYLSLFSLYLSIMNLFNFVLSLSLMLKAKRRNLNNQRQFKVSSPRALHFIRNGGFPHRSQENEFFIMLIFTASLEQGQSANI